MTGLHRVTSWCCNHSLSLGYNKPYAFHMSMYSLSVIRSNHLPLSHTHAQPFPGRILHTRMSTSTQHLTDAWSLPKSLAPVPDWPRLWRSLICTFTKVLYHTTVGASQHSVYHPSGGLPILHHPTHLYRCDLFSVITYWNNVAMSRTTTPIGSQAWCVGQGQCIGHSGWNVKPFVHSFEVCTTWLYHSLSMAIITWKLCKKIYPLSFFHVFMNRHAKLYNCLLVVVNYIYINPPCQIKTVSWKLPDGVSNSVTSNSFF